MNKCHRKNQQKCLPAHILSHLTRQKSIIAPRRTQNGYKTLIAYAKFVIIRFLFNISYGYKTSELIISWHKDRARLDNSEYI